VRRTLADAYAQWVAGHGARGEWAEARAALDRFEAHVPDDPRIPQFRRALP